MHIKYYFDDVDSELKYPTAQSNVYAAGLDCIQGLLMDLGPSNNNELNELALCLKEDEFEWWGEATHIIGKQEKIQIYTPNSYNDEHASLSRKQFQSIISDWKLFLKNKKPMEKNY